MNKLIKKDLFIGRKTELNELNGLLTKKNAALVVIRGRRRIGKSRLIQEFARDKRFYSFSGLVPTPETTAQLQRDEFSRQIGEQLGITGIKADDWGNLFALLAKSVATSSNGSKNNKGNKTKTILLLDEISWMGSKDPTFLGKLKIAWDTYFSQNSQLILVLCGSVSSWIEKNIISSAGFFGRITLKITLQELNLQECNLLLDSIGFKGSVLEKFMLLAITGGVPWYIELINPQLAATENIKRLCFQSDGILVDEFQQIFHDLFERRSNIYRKIVEYLAQGPAEYSAISKALNYPSGGPLSDYLDDIVLSGFVSCNHLWLFKSGKEAKLSQYRLRDNYLRFYLKYINPNLNKIQNNRLANVSLISLPGWNSMMGLQFENLVLNNRNLICQKIGIRLEEIVADNPYFQRKTAKQDGCQIDYLIQTKFNTLYICEIKFSRNEIKLDVVDEMQRKIKTLKFPKNFAAVPVLIHMDGISDAITDAEYFGAVIDFAELLLE